MRISDWSSDVCSSDLLHVGVVHEHTGVVHAEGGERGRDVEFDAIDLAVADVGRGEHPAVGRLRGHGFLDGGVLAVVDQVLPCADHFVAGLAGVDQLDQVLDVAIEEVDADHAALAEAALVAEVEARSEEHTSELQSLMRISYSVFCLQKKKNNN